MKYIIIVFMTLCMFVTCCNVQAIRDAYAPEPSPIETLMVGTFSRLVSEERGGSHAD